MTDAFDIFFRDEALTKERDHLDNVRMLLEDMLEKASRFMNWKRRDLAESIGDEIKEHLIHKRRMEAHIRALQEWVPSHEFTETDFETQINQKTRQYLSSRINIEEQEEFVRYKRLIEAANRPPVGDDEVEEIIDDQNELAPNTHCPICQKKIEELADPVVDQKGVVYEREMIELHLGRVGQGRDLEAPCPVAGTSHMVSLSTLTAATRVRHLIRNKRKHHRTENKDAIL